jgi:lipopolysaccharide export system permease protein
MKIISRYIRGEILKYFGMVLATVVVIYLVVDFIEKIDNFLSAGVGMATAGKYFVFKLPLILTQIIPIGTLLAVLIALGLMARNNELIALRAGGVGLLALIRPVAVFGMIASLAVILLAETVTPVTNSIANQIWLERRTYGRAADAPQNDIWVQLKHSILHMKYYHSASRTGMGVTLHRFDDSFKMVERIEADKAMYVDTGWKLRKGTRQRLNPRTGQFDIEFFDVTNENLGISPADLRNAAPRAEEMSFMQLHRYITKVKSEGYQVRTYLVDWHAKIAFPFACLIMALLGASLTFSGKLKEGLPLSIALGIGIAFVYYIAFSFCVSLGYIGLLPPLVAVWIVNWIWICLAGLLLLNADR